MPAVPAANFNRVLLCTTFCACLCWLAEIAAAQPFPATPAIESEWIDEEALLFAPRDEVPVVEPRRKAQDKERAPVKLSSWWIPAQNVRGQTSELSFVGLAANLAFPLWIDPGGQEIWLATLGFEHLEIGGNAILPDSLVPVPDDLWKLNLGSFHSLEFDNGWRVGSLLSIGTASDEPFAEARDLTFTGVGFLNVPSGPRDAWEFSLFYATTSQLPFPIPGLAYVWRPSEQFTANIGVPFSLWYHPTDSFTFTASYRPLTNLSLRATQNLGSYWSLYSSYQIVNETYWLAERQNSQDRLYLFDQRVALGLERTLPFGWSLDLSAAYLFDRRLFQAESFSDDRRDVLNLEPGPALSLLLRWER